MSKPDIRGIAAHIENADDGDIGLIGLANAINATLIYEPALTDDEVRELYRLKRAAIDKVCV